MIRRADLADVSAGRRRVPLARRRQPGLSGVVHAAAGPRFGARAAALARRLGRGARCASGSRIPTFPKANSASRSPRSAPNANPSSMTTRLEAILPQLCASTAFRTELFETTKRQAIVSQELGRNSISSLAQRLGDDDRARRRAVDRARTGAARRRHARRRQSRREALPRPQPRDPRRADAVGRRDPERAAGAGAERAGEAARRARAPSTTLPAWGNALVAHVAVPPAPSAARSSAQLANGMTLIVSPAQISDTVLVYGGVAPTRRCKSRPAKKASRTC